VTEPGWGSLRDELAADVRRVSDRLRGLSTARLAAPPAPSADGWPAHDSCAQAGRAVAQELADVALALDAAADDVPYERRDLPVLSDLAAGDVIALVGHDLLAAMDRTGPDTPLRLGTHVQQPAQHGVEHAARALADLRRRL
jgi:hypothetical protein